MSQAGAFPIPGGAGTVTSVTGGANISITGTPTVAPVINVSGTTLNSVIIGTGTVGLTSLPVGTNGEVLIGATGGPPEFALLTSTGGTILFTTGPNSLNLEAAAPVTIDYDGDTGTATSTGGVINFNGGHNITTSASGSSVVFNVSGTTQFDLQVGNATGSLSSLTPGTAGATLLSGGAAANPAFVVPTAGSGLSVTTNATTLSYALSAPVSVANGGTGLTTLTPFYTLVGNGTSPVALIAPSAGSGLPYISQGLSANPAFGVATVPGGGTGQVTFAVGGLLVGNGTTAIPQISTGTAGQVLLAGGAATNPAFVTPTAGAGLLVTTNATTLSYALNAPVTVPNGGTGDTTFTAYSVITAGTTATGAFQNVVGVGTSGQVLVSAGAGALPAWTTIAAGGVTSISGNTGGALTGAITITGASTGLTFAGSGTTETLGGTLIVGNGGTGAVSLTGVLLGNGTSAVTGITPADNGVLISSATGVPSWLADGTTGQVLTATTGSPPSWAAASGSGALTLVATKTASASASLTWTSGIATFTTYLLTFSDVITSAGGFLELLFSVNGGSTYLTTGYISGYNEASYNSATLTNVNSTTYCILVYNQPTSGTLTANGYVWLYNLASAVAPFATGQYACYAGGTTLQTGNGSSYNTTTSGVNALQVLASSGTITTGKFSLYSLGQ